LIGKRSSLKVMSRESRRKISIANRGRKLSEETKQRMVKAQTELNGRNVRIGSKIFSTLTSAAKYLGINGSSMHYQLNSENFPDIEYVS